MQHVEMKSCTKIHAHRLLMIDCIMNSGKMTPLIWNCNKCTVGPSINVNNSQSGNFNRKNPQYDDLFPIQSNHGSPFLLSKSRNALELITQKIEKDTSISTTAITDQEIDRLSAVPILIYAHLITAVKPALMGNRTSINISLKMSSHVCIQGD